MTPLKKETELLEKASEQLLETALKLGAEACEVCGSFSQKTKVALEKQDFHMSTSDDSYQLGVRVSYSNRQGFVSTNSLTPQEMKLAATKALEIAKLSKENPHQTIQPTGNVSIEAPRWTPDPLLTQVSLSTQQDWAKLLIAEASQDARMRINDGSVAVANQVFLVKSSQGTHKIDQDSIAQWSLMGMGVEGETITSFDHFMGMERNSKKVSERVVRTTEHFCQKLLSGLRIGPAKSYKGLTVFSPRAVKDIFFGALSYHVSGRSLVEKTSKWNLDAVHKLCLNPKINLIDNPWLTDRLGFTTFDREGTPTLKTALFKQGVLQGFMLDHYAAHAIGKLSTGHAKGSPSTPPTVGPHNLILEPGETSLIQLTQKITDQQSDFLLVNRFSGQTDPITGDFSGVAKAGDWWHQGERVYSVSETLISGNIFECLGDELFDLSLQTEIIDNYQQAPYLVADNVSITSKS